MCATAASTPSTTLAEMTVSRYSVDQSSSFAGLTRASTARVAGAAHAGAPHLGIENDRPCHVELRRPLHVDVANAFQMRKDRHARFLLHARDQALAAAR